ncbi:MAG: hypothetical protein ACK4FJ_12165 [Ferrovibrio sp.]
MHRSFLYQHLYGVACVLTLAREKMASIRVENDEDIEVLFPDRTLYIQVKTRTALLQRADVSSALERFKKISERHDSGERASTPFLFIVSNTEPTSSLAEDIKSPAWPSNVSILTPNSPSTEVPPAWATVNEAVKWCIEAANKIPLASLPSETLVWKLAAKILETAVGEVGRTIDGTQLPALLEQLVSQLHDFPEPPESYRPQIDEPPLVTDSHFRLILGFSGSGKTSWASQAALHCPYPLAYIDVRDIPSAAVPNNIARELAARFLGGKKAGIGAALFAESTGLNVLRACAAALINQNANVCVVIDNIHLLDPQTVRSIIDVAPNIRFLCLGQPWTGSAVLEAVLAVSVEHLKGWSTDDIAAEFRGIGAPASIEETLRVKKLTGGLPLYVTNAAHIAVRDCGGNVTAFCDAI